MNEEIRFISIKKVHPHPMNPRNSLGASDLDDLVESVKAQGILQPLTVIPAAEKGDGEYYVVMGHRRLAAAKKAKLGEVPCVVRDDMTQQDVIHAMLGENIVRRGLNVAEEAAGFQTALALGLSEEEVAEKSGFSTKTIQRRTKLTRLDKDGLSKAASKGVPLGTFEKIAALEDPELRQKALEKAGSKEFDWEFTRLKNEDQSRQARKAALPKVDLFAKEIDKDTAKKKVSMQWLNYSTAAAEDYKAPENACDPGLPEDAELPEGKIRVYYTDNGNGFQIYRDRTAADDDKATAEAAKEAESKARDQKVKALNALCAEVRGKFIGSVAEKNCVAHMSDIMGAFTSLFTDNYVSLNKRSINPKLKRYTKKGFEDVEKLVEKSPAKAFFLIVAATMDAESGDVWNSGNYVGQDYRNGGYVIVRKKSPCLDQLYDLLEKMGYELSEDERQVKDGTHEIYDPVAVPVPDPEDESDEECDDEDACQLILEEGVIALFAELGFDSIPAYLAEHPDDAADDLRSRFSEEREIEYLVSGETYTVAADSNAVYFATEDVYEWDAFVDAVREWDEMGFWSDDDDAPEQTEAAPEPDPAPEVKDVSGDTPAADEAPVAPAADEAETAESEEDIPAAEEPALNEEAGQPEAASEPDDAAAVPVEVEIVNAPLSSAGPQLTAEDKEKWTEAIRTLFREYNMFSSYSELSEAPVEEFAGTLRNTLCGAATHFEIESDPDYMGCIIAEEDCVTVKESGSVSGQNLTWTDFTNLVLELEDNFQTEIEEGDWSYDEDGALPF